MEGSMVTEAFTAAVAEKLGELTGEKPLVGERELREALAPESGTFEVSGDELAEALDELAAASVAVQVGHNAEQGRMWRHSGMTAEEAQGAIDAERRQAAREAERDAEADEAEALERAAEIEREQGDGAEEQQPAAVSRARELPMSVVGALVERVELPMSVVGALSPEAVAEIVQAGVAAAKESGASFEFKVTA
jgi:hypothetical protein